MEHKIISSRSSGHDGWRIRCSCGWSTSGWRWLCEERWLDHQEPWEYLYEPPAPIDPQLNEDPDEDAPIAECERDMALDRRALLHPNYHDGF